MARAIESTHGKLVATTTANGWYQIFTHWSISGEYKTLGEVEKNGRVWRTQGRAFATLEKAAQHLANSYFSAPAPAEIEAQAEDQIAAEIVAAEQAQAPAESVQLEHDVTATKAGRFYNLTATRTGRALGSIETSFRGVFYAFGHAFATLEKAAKFLAKQVLAVYQHENGSALADLQAQTECEAYFARAFEEELQREQATRQMYEQAPAYTPKKFILGRADGTAKIIHNTGETELIPARNQAENLPKN